MESNTRQKTIDFFTSYPAHTFDKQQLILHPDDTLRYIIYIVEGRVSQYDITANGNVVVVNVFKPGAYFPMSWAINKSRNPYFFEASTKVIAHLAPVENTLRFLHDNKDVLYSLLSRVYRNSDGLVRRMAHLMGGDAKSRLFFELLTAAYRFGEVQPNGKIFVPLKEGDIASQSGLARETVNRQLQSLKRSGLIVVTHQGYILNDFTELELKLGDEL